MKIGNYNVQYITTVSNAHMYMNFMCIQYNVILKSTYEI